MKKKILAVAIAAIMLVTAIASVSLAYMTDTDEQTNTMTVGKVEIDQLEYERVVDSNDDGLMEWVSSEKTDDYGYTPDQLQEFNQNKPLYPVVCLETLGKANEGSMKWDDRVSGHQQSWAQVGAPGSNQLFDDSCKNVVDKFVFVKNTGKSDVYVRTIIAFEQGDLTAAEIDDMIGINANEYHWDLEEIAQDVDIKGNKYAIICFTYRGPKQNTAQGGILEPDEVSRPSLLQVYLASKATNDTVEKIDGNDNGKYDILVLSQATQTNGFVNSTNDLENSTLALDTAFGDVTAENAAEWLAHLAEGKPQE